MGEVPLYWDCKLHTVWLTKNKWCVSEMIGVVSGAGRKLE